MQNYKQIEVMKNHVSKQTKKKRKKRYTWSFYRMHPIAQAIMIGILGGLFSKLIIKFAWLIAILYHIAKY